MKVLIGLSGGVDSSVAAKLLCDEGHEVVGMTMQLLSPIGDIKKNQDRDISDAKAVADKLGIKHIIYDFRKEFKEKIIEYFISEYKKGRTPNPCFICNKQIKFGLLLERALEDGFDAIATGHYAGIVKTKEFGDEKYLLEKATDTKKDQSYFLALLSQEQLKHCLFPLAKYTKDEIRKIAEEAQLINANRPDSQDICFVPDDDYTKIINTIAKDSFKEGKFISPEGKELGTHKGLQYYTVGQRRGLAIAMGYPVYVVDKNAETNTVIIGRKEELFAKSLIAEDVNLIAFDNLNEEITVTVKTRYRQKEIPAKLIPQENGELKVEFINPERAVAEGQAVVFYSDKYILGGGVIKSVERISAQET